MRNLEIYRGDYAVALRHASEDGLTFDELATIRGISREAVRCAEMRHGIVLKRRPKRKRLMRTTWNNGHNSGVPASNDDFALHQAKTFMRKHFPIVVNAEVMDGARGDIVCGTKTYSRHEFLEKYRELKARDERMAA